MLNVDTARIQAKGGNGGNANVSSRGIGNDGTNGADAILTCANGELFIENYGIIGGGGGGGGSILAKLRLIFVTLRCLFYIKYLKI